VTEYLTYVTYRRTICDLLVMATGPGHSAEVVVAE
jgi:hypothetical protein